MIHRIEWDDGHICVLADDNVMVTKVTVISDDGKRLEQAEARRHLEVWWDYQVTHRGLIDLATELTEKIHKDLCALRGSVAKVKQRIVKP